MAAGKIEKKIHPTPRQGEAGGKIQKNPSPPAPMHGEAGGKMEKNPSSHTPPSPLPRQGESGGKMEKKSIFPPLAWKTSQANQPTSQQPTSQPASQLASQPSRFAENCGWPKQTSENTRKMHPVIILGSGCGWVLQESSQQESQLAANQPAS